VIDQERREEENWRLLYNYPYRPQEQVISTSAFCKGVHDIEVLANIKRLRLPPIDHTLNIHVGTNTNGRVDFDLKVAPHFMIGGKTGGGKSSYFQAVLAGLMMNMHPTTLHIVVLDGKGTDFTPLADIVYLAKQLDGILDTLQKLAKVSKARYDFFAGRGFQNIYHYNRSAANKGGVRIPHTVIFFDEYQTTYGLYGKKERDIFQAAVQAIVCQAASAGLHFVLCSQSNYASNMPLGSKVNFTYRMSFKTGSREASIANLTFSLAEYIQTEPGFAVYMLGDLDAVYWVKAPHLPFWALKRVVQNMADLGLCFCAKAPLTAADRLLVSDGLILAPAA
jgi:hypothetical protein